MAADSTAESMAAEEQLYASFAGHPEPTGGFASSAVKYQHTHAFERFSRSLAGALPVSKQISGSVEQAEEKAVVSHPATSLRFEASFET